MLSTKMLILGLYVIPVILFLIGFLLLTIDVSSFHSLSEVSVTRRQLDLLENVSTDRTTATRSQQAQPTANNVTDGSLTRTDQVRPPACELIHIAIPVSRHTEVLVLLKSLLLYRKSPLHFYFLTTEQYVGEALKKLMKTWRLPGVEFTVHKIAKHQLSVFPESISPEEFSVAGKLLLPILLPTQVEKVIYMDTDFIITGDIKELWTYFYQANNSTALFGVHNTSVFCQLQPSLMLLNLKAMRTLEWRARWMSLVLSTGSTDSSQPVLHPSTVLCASTKHFNHFEIPCYWNVDLKNTTASKECSRSNSVGRNTLLGYATPENKAFHGWNLADDVTASSKLPKYFIKLKAFINHYDSSLLSYVPLACVNHTGNVELNEEAMIAKALSNGQDKLMCQILKQQSKRVFRTVMYFFGRPYKPVEDHETTLVTQLSMDRLRTFSLLVNQWNGPISISMYGTDIDAWKLSEFVSTFKTLSKRSNVNVHLVFQEGKFYPVNYLRNIALGAVTTPYVFLNDGDFIPVANLFSYLKKTTKALLSKQKEKTLLVVPAFETAKFSLKFPKNKIQLLQLIRQKLVSQFCVTCAHKTHAPTDYRMWFKARDPYIIEWASHFEPYIVVKSNVARYDERFIGYGFNKVSQITELKAQGYQFVVLPEAFIVHTPHAPSIDKKIWEHKSFKSCINSIWEQFMKDLKVKYGKNCLQEKKSPPKVIRI